MYEKFSLYVSQRLTLEKPIHQCDIQLWGVNPRGQAWGRSGICLHLLCLFNVMESKADTEHDAIGILQGLQLLMKQGLSFKETCHFVE